jgi:type I restriction-modification system DNA methylase subunit
VVLEIMQEDIKFLAFIDSTSPLINSFLQNDVFLQNISCQNHFDLIFNSFKVKSKNNIIPFHSGISKVLATLIFDYLYIGIVTLQENHDTIELILNFQEKRGSNNEHNNVESKENQAKSFLDKVINQIKDKNPEIPLFHNQILPMDRIISSLLEDFQISTILCNFFIENFSRPINYNQMKTPYHFELGIPWEHKQQYGQVFTPITVVDFMCKQLISKETSLILDPSVGTGLFLMRALIFIQKSGFSSLPTIIGIEKDPILAIICESAILVYCELNSISTIDCQIINDNLFDCDEKLSLILDKNKGNGLILMNPPYTRQELISSSEKIHMTKKLESIPFFNKNNAFSSLIKFSGQSSLYVYFIIYISGFLHPNDHVGLIIPNSWMDVRYGEVLRTLFLELYSTHYIISSKLEKFIPSVDVNTSILFLQVKEKPFKFLSKNSTRKVNFVAINSQYDLTQINTPIRSSKHHFKNQGTLTKASEAFLSRNSKWGLFLKAPSFFFKLLSSIQDKSVELGTQVFIKRGFTSGANAFFYLGKPGRSNNLFYSTYDSATGNLILTPKNDKIVQEFINQNFPLDSLKFEIERDYWMHPVNSLNEERANKIEFITDENTKWIPNYLVKSPKELSTYEITNENLNYIVLIIPKEEKTKLKAGIRKYIRWGEKWNPLNGNRYNKRITCSLRKFWYAISSSEYVNFPILCMMTINDRFTFFYNRNDYFFDARLYGIRLITSMVNIPALFCYLNSIFVSLQLELLGRNNLGEGGLDVKVYEYNSIKILFSSVLDKNLSLKVKTGFYQILRENPSSIIDNTENLTEGILDDFLIDLALFSQKDVTHMRKALQGIVQNRLDKGRSVSNHNT